MHFTQLRFDDFGCFQNARLEDLSDGLVVIGGPQRAGKTTFLMAMRQLRSGIERVGGLPPATDEYRIDGEIIHDDQPYRYVLTGHAAPSISSLNDGSSVAVEDIFGPVTERQYRQLFTISLDELQQLPPGIDDTDDLAEVLLGAAYGDIAEVPKIKEVFEKRANDIGLKRGSPTAKTTQLHDPYQRIQEGLEARREANRQVDQHEGVSDTLQTKQSELSDIKDHLKKLRKKQTRLNVLSELFNTLVEIDELEATLEGVDVDAAATFPIHRTERIEELREEFEAAADGLREAKQEFERSVSVADPDEYRGWLLDNEDRIEEHGESRKMWSNQVDGLSETETELSEQRREIESRIGQLHSEWGGGSFDHIESVETSAISASRVAALADTVSEQRDEFKTEQKDRDRKRRKHSKLEDKRDRMSEEEPDPQQVTVPIRKPAAVAATAIAVGTVAAIVVTPLAGGIVGLIVVAVGMYTIDTTIDVEQTVDVEPRRELSGQIVNLEGEITVHEDYITELKPELESNEGELQELAERLGLPEDIPPSGVASFYEEIVKLDEAIQEYRTARAEWKANREELVEELSQVASVFEDGPRATWDPDNPLKTADSLLSRLEEAVEDLGNAKEIRDAGEDRTDHLNRINDILSKTDELESLDMSADIDTVGMRVEQFAETAADAEEITDANTEHETLVSRVESRFENPSTREVFEPVRENDEPWLDVVRSAADEYADVSAIDSASRSLEQDIKTKESTRDDLQEQCRELKEQREDLASEDDLRAAQEKIDEGRIEFERVGESYAVNRIAEKLLNDVHEQFMADIVDSLVDDASEIFSDITGAYDGIELSGGLQDLEFRATRPTSPDHGVSELSRATAEQLFLAVRLARIKQTKVSLPIVIDDAATNFDPGHAARVFKFLDGLAETSQVFFLTCHPGFVHLASSNGAEGQYWGLDDGRFEKMGDPEALQRRLGNGVGVGSI